MSRFVTIETNRLFLYIVNVYADLASVGRILPNEKRFDFVLPFTRLPFLRLPDAGSPLHLEPDGFSR